MKTKITAGMESHQIVAAEGLKPLWQGYIMLGMVADDDLKADDVERLHALATSDIRKLVLRIKNERAKVCAVMYYDGNPVNSMVRSLLSGNGIPCQYITTISPETANDKTIWYANNWKKTFLESCSLVLNYGNEELTEYADENDVPGVEVIDRPLRDVGKTLQNLQSEPDPYGAYWVQVQQHTKVIRQAYRGLRINQVIDLRPPKLWT